MFLTDSCCNSRERRARSRLWLPSARNARRSARRRKRSRRGSRRKRRGRKPRRTPLRCRSRRRTQPMVTFYTFLLQVLYKYVVFEVPALRFLTVLNESALSESEVPIEPPSATTTTTIGISATSTTFTTAFGKKRASVATTPSTNRKNKKNKTKDSSPNEPIILQDPQVSVRH